MGATHEVVCSPKRPFYNIGVAVRVWRETIRALHNYIYNSKNDNVN